MRRCVQLLAALLFMAMFVGCESEDATQKYLIASRKGWYHGPGFDVRHYNVYDYEAKKWISVEYVYDMKYEYGTEYIVLGKLSTPKEMLQEGWSEGYYRLYVEEVISQEVKESDLPEDIAQNADSYEEKFGKK